MGVLRREAWLARLAGFGEGRCALEFDGIRLGYAELARAATAAADRLETLGIEPGDLVAVLAPPSVPGIILIHAMLARGVVMLPVNARLTRAEQRDALAATGARYLIVMEEEVAEAMDSASNARRLVEGLGCGLLVLRAARAGTGADLEQCDAASPAMDEAAPARRADRLAEGAALVLQTSGTSGRPKSAVLAFDNLMASADAAASLLGSAATDRWLLCMPLFHIGGLSILIRSALVGAAVVLHARFEAEAVAHALERDGINRVSFVATMLERILSVRRERRAPQSLSLVLLGGGPASAALLDRAQRLGYPLAPTYGLTEAASQVATRPPRPVGAPGDDLAGGLEALPGVEIRIVDANRQRLAAGVEGEIEVRGPIVMRGYLDDSQATREAIREGWLATGDLGCLDAAGRLRVFDRRADLILSGGENVYPAEIESALLEAKGIIDAGVFGIPDAEFGARPAAFVVLGDDAVFDPDALSTHCRARMANFKRPVEIRSIDALPRTATGKLLRRALREFWEAER